MNKISVLFVCIHNSARSQMAEAFLNKLAGDRFHAESAGLEPGMLNPVVVDAMKEVGIDISGNQTKDVFQFFKEGRIYQYVITVCDQTAAERCPIFPGIAEKLHWSFPDPSALKGKYEDKLRETRKIRDLIKNKIEEWTKEFQNHTAELKR
ncbi:MAG TPA: arsenate reductase ArsC [Ignavibacteriaceae bacterium]|nr:arsenate reductase ArsC [Ignavibacteriaceae bacterium]